MKFPPEQNPALHQLIQTALKVINAPLPFKYAEQLDSANEIFLLMDKEYVLELRWIIEMNLDLLKDKLIIGHISGKQLTFLWNTTDIPDNYADGSTIELSQESHYSVVNKTIKSTDLFNIHSQVVFDFRKLTRKNQHLAVHALSNKN
jgi:hypothetical protein